MRGGKLASDGLWNLIKSCWAQQAQERLTAREITEAMNKEINFVDPYWHDTQFNKCWLQRSIQTNDYQGSFFISLLQCLNATVPFARMIVCAFTAFCPHMSSADLPV